MEMIQLVGLEDFADKYPSQLSGGMNQRLAIARALALDPDILLMDEPFGALDEQTRRLMGLELLRIQDRTHKTIVFVTHSIQEAIQLSDRILLMSMRPSVIREEIRVPLPRPRSIESLTTDIAKDIERAANGAGGALALIWFTHLASAYYFGCNVQLIDYTCIMQR